MTEHTLERRPKMMLGQPGMKIDDAYGALCFTSDSKRLAAGYRSVQIWDLQQRQVIATFKAPERIDAMGFAADDQRLWLKGDRKIMVWSGGKLDTLATFEQRISGVDFRPELGLIAAGGRQKIPVVIDAQSGETVLSFKAHRADIYGVGLSPCGRRLVTSSGKLGRIWSFDKPTGKPVSLRGATSPLGPVKFSPDGNLVLGMTFKYQLCVWNAQDGALLWQDTSVWGVPGFSPDSQRLIFNQIAVFGPEDKAWSLVERNALDGASIRAAAIGDSVRRLKLSPDGKTVAFTVGSHKGLGLWSLEEGRDLGAGTGHQGRVYDVLRLTSEPSFATGAEDTSVRVWGAEDSALKQTLDLGNYAHARSMALNSDGQKLVVTAGIRTHLYSTSDWTQIWSAATDLQTAHKVTWLRNDEIIMILCTKEYKSYPRAFFVDAATGEVLKRHDRLPFELRDICPDHDGQKVTTIGSQGAIVWDLQTMNIVSQTTYKDLDHGFFSSLSQDGNQALFNHSSHLSIIETMTGRTLRRLAAPDIVSATYIKADALVLGTTAKGQWTLWDAHSGKTLQSAAVGKRDTRQMLKIDDELVATMEGEGDVTLWSISDLEAPPQEEEDDGDLHNHLATLRELLYAEPTDEHWDKLCASLDQWQGDLEVGLEYAAERLQSWPDQLRKLPQTWQQDVVLGRPQPRARLARMLYSEDTQAAHIEAWLGAKDLQNLTTISLSGKGLNNDAAKMLARGRWPSLRSLSLSRGQFKITGARALSKAAFLSSLETLHINHTPIGTKGAKALVEQEALSKLDSLTLWHCNITGQAFEEAFAAAQHLSSLTQLNLSSNMDLDLSCIARATHLTQLKALSIHDSFRNYGISRHPNALQEVLLAPHLRTLEKFDLFNPDMNQNHAEALLNAPMLSNLKELDIHMGRDVPASLIERVLAGAPHLNERSIKRLERMIKRRT
mgnify:CR=1 FL=1